MPGFAPGIHGLLQQRKNVDSRDGRANRSGAACVLFNNVVSYDARPGWKSMRRRKFITLFGGVVAGWSLAARAQAPPLIGFMTSRSLKDSEPHTAAFLRGLSQAGYVPAQNVGIEYRWADGQYERLPEIAAELARLPLAALVAAGGEPSALAAKGATATVPIIFVIGGDPVKAGLAASLNRPGGNATGISFVTAELGGKRVSLISELAPNAKAIALLVNPNMSETDAHIKSARMGADTLGRRLLVLRASTPADLEPSFKSIVKESAGALVVQNDPFFDSQRDRLIALAAQYAIPAIYHIREYPTAGGLMSYGASLLDAYSQVGIITGRVLKGEHPQDIPVLQPTRFELVINSKTARSLQLTIPPQMLALADEVIE
jgi:putative ABC transport system substrate-binding protein